MVDYQSHLKKLSCGLFQAPVDYVEKWDRVSYNIIKKCVTQLNKSEYSVDIKVHMLMPNQYPCIPNWHCDMVPRDDNLKQDFSRVDKDLKMYLWLSNDPITEFKDGREVKIQEWNEFTQLDGHRGAKSSKHIWRMFIRLVPQKLLSLSPKDKWKRRHSQVYLDSKTFSW